MNFFHNFPHIFYYVINKDFHFYNIYNKIFLYHYLLFHKHQYIQIHILLLENIYQQNSSPNKNSIYYLSHKIDFQKGISHGIHFYNKIDQFQHILNKKNIIYHLNLYFFQYILLYYNYQCIHY